MVPNWLKREKSSSGYVTASGVVGDSAHEDFEGGDGGRLGPGRVALALDGSLD